MKSCFPSVHFNILPVFVDGFEGLVVEMEIKFFDNWSVVVVGPNFDNWLATMVVGPSVDNWFAIAVVCCNFDISFVGAVGCNFDYLLFHLSHN